MARPECPRRDPPPAGKGASGSDAADKATRRAIAGPRPVTGAIGLGLSAEWDGSWGAGRTDADGRSALHLPHGIAASLTLLVGVLATGGLHKDGLADGFGGGRTHERKLEIMPDSRIGSYGTLPLILSLGLLWQALASLPPVITRMIFRI